MPVVLSDACVEGQGHCLNRRTQETSAFSQPSITVEGKCAFWSQTALDTDFQLPSKLILNTLKLGRKFIEIIK